MGNWKQINLTDAVGKFVFDDNFGFMRVDAITYEINDKGIENYFVDGANGRKKKLVVSMTNAEALIALFSESLYCENRNYSGKKTDNKYLGVVVETITANVYFANRYGRQNTKYKIKQQDKERLTYISRVWTCSQLQSVNRFEDLLTYPLFKDLKKGGEVFFDGRKCVINKVYPQPNEKGLMISVKDGNEEKDLSFSDKIYSLPYDERGVSQTEIFNKSKNEGNLNPIAEKSDSGLSIYWNKIDAAAEYIVSLYKIINRPYLQNVYHLADYTAERNDDSITVEGSGVDAITVKAMDRQGNVIAQSRGIQIDNAYLFAPKLWQDSLVDFRNLGIYSETNGSRTDSSLICPQFSDLKKGLEIIYNGSRYKINKVYAQPNKNGLAIEVLSNNYYRRTFNISLNDRIYVDAKNLKSSSQFEIFDNCKNEFDLSPFAVKSGQCLCVYWDKPDNAAEYTVSLYKTFDRPYNQNIYHVKDYIVDRNKGYIAINGLSGQNYIVTVRAENRAGEEIARSRGIFTDKNDKLCFPKFWK